jgi:hypothetical protein
MFPPTFAANLYVLLIGFYILYFLPSSNSIDLIYLIITSFNKY